MDQRQAAGGGNKGEGGSVQFFGLAGGEESGHDEGEIVVVTMRGAAKEDLDGDEWVPER